MFILLNIDLKRHNFSVLSPQSSMQLNRKSQKPVLQSLKIHLYNQFLVKHLDCCVHILDYCQVSQFNTSSNISNHIFFLNQFRKILLWKRNKHPHRVDKKLLLNYFIVHMSYNFYWVQILQNTIFHLILQHT